MKGVEFFGIDPRQVSLSLSLSLSLSRDRVQLFLLLSNEPLLFNADLCSVHRTQLGTFSYFFPVRGEKEKPVHSSFIPSVCSRLSVSVSVSTHTRARARKHPPTYASQTGINGLSISFSDTKIFFLGSG